MIALLLLAALGTGNEPKQVDIAEVNTVYREDGEIAFTQVVLWRWGRYPLPGGPDHHVAQWFIVDSDSDSWKVNKQFGGRYLFEFRTRNGKVRKVSARSFRPPTKTLIDHEKRDQRELPPSFRHPYFEKGTR